LLLLLVVVWGGGTSLFPKKRALVEGGWWRGGGEALVEGGGALAEGERASNSVPIGREVETKEVLAVANLRRDGTSELVSEEDELRKLREVTD
jgi:hypothetical protein